MARKSKRNAGSALALVGIILVAGFAIKHPVIIALLLISSALWWLIKKNTQAAPLVWNIDPEDPPPVKQIGSEYRGEEKHSQGSGSIEQPKDWEIGPSKINSIATLRFCYTNNNGEDTSRTVDVTSFDSWYINGFCRLKGGPRTFTIEKITNCVDIDTGEVAQSPYWHLVDVFKKSVWGSLKNLIENHNDFVRVLVHVGEADGRLMKQEKEIIADVLRKVSGDDRITIDHVDSIRFNVDFMTETAYERAICRMQKNTYPHRALLLWASESIIATQKKVHPIEEAILNYMRKKFIGVLPVPIKNYNR